LETICSKLKAWNIFHHNKNITILQLHKQEKMIEVLVATFIDFKFCFTVYLKFNLHAFVDEVLEEPEN
jgi:hypothetical protein